MNIAFYRLRTNKKLFSFEDEIGAVPVLGEPLRDVQEKNIVACGGKLIDVNKKEEINEKQYFLFDDDLCFSGAFIKAVIELAEKSDSSFRTILDKNTFNDRFVLPHSQDKSENLKFNFFFVKANSPEQKDIIVPQRIFPFINILPDQIVAGKKYHFDQCDRFIVRMASPFHLLQANIAANFSRLVKIRGRFPQWMADRFAAPHSRMNIRSLRSLNRKGKNCCIHPSAIVENVIMGDDVTIGANAVIRHSFIGTGTNIMENCTVLNSVLGKRNVISNGNVLNLVLTYEDVFLIHGPYQFSVFGRSTAVFAVINCDIRLDQKNIAIPTDVGVIDSGQPLLGIAYGHFSKVGGGNIIAAGRIVPNHKVILPPDNIILRIDP